jgi:broad specificity phosphatase PhoE
MRSKIHHLHTHSLSSNIQPGQAMHNPRAEARKAAGCSHEEFLLQMQADDVLDAPLTKVGHSQGQAVYDQYSHYYRDRIQVVVSSPLTRALQTANLALPPTSLSSSSSSSSPRRVCLESIREINGWLLNAKRRPKSQLKLEFPHWEFHRIEDEEDGTWTADSLESESDCGERGYQSMLALLQDIPETRILLVAHGGILRFLMSQHDRVSVADGRTQNGATGRPEPDARFDNCELRRYRLEALSGCDSHGQATENEKDGGRPRLVLTQVDMDAD